MKTNYANLDVLRSLAVLSVVAAHWRVEGVAFHLWAYDPGINQLLHNLSYTGVMFFFVHTCLVLMLSMHRAPAIHRGSSFLVRRAFRIYPLCWATIFLVLTTGLTDQPDGTVHAMGWHGIVANLLLVQNMARSIPSVIGPLWSLPWEVQMYLVLPLFFFVLRRFAGRPVVFALWLGAVLLAIAATQPSMPRLLHAAIFPPMFIAGMVAFKLLEGQREQPSRAALPAWAWPLFVAGLFAVQGGIVGWHSFESSYAAGVNACICLVLALAIPQFGELKVGWIAHPAAQVAKYSYGIYLLHVPALVFVFRYLPQLPLALKLIAFITLTALLSFVSFHLIENPLIRQGKRLAERVQAPHVSGLIDPVPSSAVPATYPVAGSGQRLCGRLSVFGQAGEK
ncbi:MAG: acyltransferase [Terracidiphilus sp.]|jgi:peptidoglycan/LPS O-acetylase OafA/YrhL